MDYTRQQSNFSWVCIWFYGWWRNGCFR